MPYADPEQQREYQRKWVARRRAEWFEGRSCVDCGSVEELQLDHVDAKQKMSHRIWSWSAALREAELAKCVVRCRFCHKIKTDELSHERAQKLSADQVREIRIRYVPGEITQQELAEDYGISREMVSQIVRWKYWK